MKPIATQNIPMMIFKTNSGLITFDLVYGFFDNF